MNELDAEISRLRDQLAMLLTRREREQRPAETPAAPSGAHAPAPSDFSVIIRSLQESEEKYRQVFSAVSDAILINDAETYRFIDVNCGAERLYGYTRDELLTLSYLDITTQVEDAKQSMNAIAAGTRFTVPLRYHRKKDGTIFPVEIAAGTFRLNGRPMLVGVVRDLTERQQALEQIRIHEAQLRRLATELSLAEERERRKLATDLHDGLCQLLVLARMKLTQLEPHAVAPEGRELLRDITGLLSASLRSARLLTFELSPPVLYDLGLPAALQWLAEQMAQRYGLNIDLRIDPDPLPMDDATRVLLFRSIRELLINAAKYAGVCCAQLTMRRKAATAIITVHDAGAGFDPDRIPTGASGGKFGLFSIRERLIHLGGTMDLRSSPGHGTDVTLTVPLQDTNPGQPQ